MYHEVVQTVLADHPAVEWLPFVVPAFVTGVGIWLMALRERRRGSMNEEADDAGSP